MGVEAPYNEDISLVQAGLPSLETGSTTSDATPRGVMNVTPRVPWHLLPFAAAFSTMEDGLRNYTRS
ncbi:hypothetical protein GGTG_06572 [Gaeumannomyces tritici R3-111a-1]|uniref:Uncharacterized protein n=1 Tax=Gaeumannomyces tritici (strain R3-111a-1) TaxID=644352 RepID=J3NZ72_GAET3|nr:hypothetical protein GGTG_06572 [Gaeumannomyces tritici R3-111a-1]EJT76655.1 hypothetical protein GGTG_06572 [Gaeumannomyces tritici R3-111a-1]